MKRHARSEQLYSLLIRCLPQTYRKDFGDDMLYAFRDMLEAQPARIAWFIVLKEFPFLLTSEYIAALKGVSNMKANALSLGWYCGLVLSVIWLSSNIICTWIIAQGPDWNISLWESPFTAMLFTPLFCGLAGFLEARQRKSLQEGIQAALLTVFLSGLVYIGSSLLLAQLPGTQAFHSGIQDMLLMINHIPYGTLRFFLLLGAVGILFGGLGGSLGVQSVAKKHVLLKEEPVHFIEKSCR